MNSIREALLPGLKLVGIMTVVCGLAYTLVVTGIGQLFFFEEANGSLITQTSAKGKEVIVGSKLMGQNFTEVKYLWGRPNTGAAASQLAPDGLEQQGLVEKRIKDIQESDSANQQKIPMELVTAAGSGVDPEISLETADYQVSRIATARDIPVAGVKRVVQNNTTGTIFGKIGSPRVNVLGVNLQLDELTD